VPPAAFPFGHLGCTAEGLHRGVDLVQTNADEARIAAIPANLAIHDHVSNRAVGDAEISAGLFE